MTDLRTLKVSLLLCQIFFLMGYLPITQATLYSVEPGLVYWQNTVREYPELAEPKVMLSWHYFQQAKKRGQLALLQKSCRQLMDALELQPGKNALRLAISLTNYQHDFGLSEQLAQHYLSQWPYDSQVYLWRLQGAISQKQDKDITTLTATLAALPEDLHTLLAEADIAGYKKDFDSRRHRLNQALKRANDPRTKAWIWLQLAVIHLDWQQNLTLADNELTHAEKLNPNSPDIQRHRIEWLVLTHRYSKAEEKLNQLQSWHQHPELKQFRAMMNGQAITTDHTAKVDTVCHQPLQQFLSTRVTLSLAKK
jgi:tetratricopeptide (TPR) repeat protein